MKLLKDFRPAKENRGFNSSFITQKLNLFKYRHEMSRNN